MGAGLALFIDNHPGQRFSRRDKAMPIRIGDVPKGFIRPRQSYGEIIRGQGKLLLDEFFCACK
jgi:hypothetical protein